MDRLHFAKITVAADHE